MIDLTSLPRGQTIYWEDEKKQLWEIVDGSWEVRSNKAQWPKNMPNGKANQSKDPDVLKAIKGLKEANIELPRAKKKIASPVKKQLSLF